MIKKILSTAVLFGVCFSAQAACDLDIGAFFCANFKSEKGTSAYFTVDLMINGKGNRVTKDEPYYDTDTIALYPSEKGDEVQYENGDKFSFTFYQCENSSCKTIYKRATTDFNYMTGMDPIEITVPIIAAP